MSKCIKCNFTFSDLEGDICSHCLTNLYLKQQDIKRKQWLKQIKETTIKK